MLQFFQSIAISPVDLVLIILLVLVIGGSLAYTIHRKKKGLSSCSSCQNCSSAAICKEYRGEKKHNETYS